MSFRFDFTHISREANLTWGPCKIRPKLPRYTGFTGRSLLQPRHSKARPRSQSARKTSHRTSCRTALDPLVVGRYEGSLKRVIAVTYVFAEKTFGCLKAKRSQHCSESANLHSILLAASSMREILWSLGVNPRSDFVVTEFWVLCTPKAVLRVFPHFLSQFLVLEAFWMCEGVLLFCRSFRDVWSVWASVSSVH